MDGTEPVRGIPLPARKHPQGRSLRWRRDQLLAAGFDEVSAQRLATDEAIDIHAMIMQREQPPPVRKGRPRGA